VDDLGSVTGIGGDDASPVSRPELNFSASSAGLITKYLYAHGCVLLRGAIPNQKVIAYRDALESIYERYDHALIDPNVKRDFDEFSKDEFDGVSRGDVSPQMFAKFSGLDVVRLFADRKLEEVFSRTMGGYQPVLTTFMSVAPSAAHSSTGISLHADGIVQGTDRFITCLWTPFQPCGVDAPGLAVMTVPREKVLAYLQYKFPTRQIPGWSSMTEWNDTGAFEVKELFRAFGHDKLWNPAMEPGDVMLFTNWTIHGSNVTRSMTKRRSAAILRLTATGSPATRGISG